MKYKLQSNYVVRLLGKLKSDSHKARLRSAVQSQHTWKSGKDILGWPSPGAPTSLVIDGELTLDIQKMAQLVEWLNMVACPWIVCADWNCEPSQLAASGPTLRYVSDNVRHNCTCDT